MQSFRHILSTRPLFLLGIPLVFLIHTANQYFGLLNWSMMTGILFLYLLVPVAAYYLLTLLTDHSRKWGVSFFWLLLVFYFFHLLHDGLKYSPLVFLSRYTILLPLLFTILFLVLWYIWKRQRDTEKFYFRANAVLLLMLVGGIIQYGYQVLTHAEKYHDQADIDKKLSRAYRPCDTCRKPDIYFLLFDGYTNTRTLEKEFGYANGFIESFLSEKGFYIPHRSRSNYNFTHMSMASEFNLDYLGRLRTDKVFYSKDFFESYYTMYENELCSILRKEGYRIVNYSIFPLRDAPLQTLPFLTELTPRSITGQTFFKKLYRDIGWHLAPWLKKNEPTRRQLETMEKDILRIRQTMDGVVESARNTGMDPRFVYAHFIMPHETFYYDSTGKRLDPGYTLKAELNKKDYVQQLAYTNRFLIAPLVDSIFRLSKKPFVIIIQGDHGYRNYPPPQINLEFDNFLSIYWTGRDYHDLNDSLTSVNVFRSMLNHLFHQSIPVLKDSVINLMKSRQSMNY